MTQQEKIDILGEILECDASILEPEKELKDISEWDSLSALSYIMYMMENFNVKKSGAEVRGFKTVQDILNSFE